MNYFTCEVVWHEGNTGTFLVAGSCQSVLEHSKTVSDEKQFPLGVRFKNIQSVRDSQVTW
jgi:hypothetical protein